MLIQGWGNKTREWCCGSRGEVDWLMCCLMCLMLVVFLRERNVSSLTGVVISGSTEDGNRSQLFLRYFFVKGKIPVTRNPFLATSGLLATSSHASRKTLAKVSFLTNSMGWSFLYLLSARAPATNCSSLTCREVVYHLLLQSSVEVIKNCVFLSEPRNFCSKLPLNCRRG